MRPDKKTSAARWTKTLHRWHWISSAVCLAGMLLFAATGITLNHAGEIAAQPRTTRSAGQLPGELRTALATETRDNAPLPPAVRAWLASALDLRVGAGAAEWSPDEIYLALPRPGGDAWLRIGRADGGVEYERTERGAIAYLNDLHKGRHTGVAWSVFIDVFSLACLIFSLTGLLLLQRHAGNRPATWPMVAAGLALPTLLAFLILH